MEYLKGKIRGKLPSVTEILSPFNDFNNIDPDVLEYSADRGTRVHSACEKYALNPSFPDLDFEDDVEPYFNCFVEWFNDNVKEVLATELHLESSLGYEGHIDLIAMLKTDDKPYIIDIKTPVTQHRTWRLQLAGYEGLIFDNKIKEKVKLPFKINQFKRMCLRLRPGKPALENIYTDPTDYKLFTQAFELFKYYYGRKKYAGA